MADVETANYDARWGYRHFDARRYERRRYGGLKRRLNFRLLEWAMARALAGVARGGVVLDVPCGTGILHPFFRSRGLRVVGMDISPAMLEVARERQDGVGHVRADLEVPPWRAGSFDVVVCVRFLMHVPAAARPRVLRTLAQLARGPLIVTVCHPYTLKALGRALRRLVGGRPKRSPRVDRAALEGEAAEAGLLVERIISVVPFLSDLWLVVLRKPAATA